ncbi:MAG: DUF2946 family protein [Stellaceae bacterium]
MRRQHVDNWSGRRGRSFSAWLAIVALLFNGLLPTGFSLAPAADAPQIGFCGRAPAPDHKQKLPAGAHCIYCLVAAVGPAPTPMPALASAQLVGIVVLPASRPRLIDRPPPFTAAQPRGPPAA